MVKTEVKEWLSKAEKDFEEANFLFNNDRPLEHVALFLHQSVEKYLKGYLISKGWQLEKTHDLVKLTRDAIKFDRGFVIFISLMERVTDYYIESRYPIGYLVEYEKEEIEESLKSIQSFIDFVNNREFL